MLNRYTEKPIATLEEQQKQIERMEARLSEYREEVARTAVQLDRQMDVIKDYDYSGIFEKQVSSARLSKWMWQIVTVIILVFLIIFSAALVTDILEEGLASEVVLGDLIFISVTTLGVYFTSRQIKNARQDEKESRDMLMELSSTRIMRD